MIEESIHVIREKGGCPIVNVCDNCPLNQGVYSLLGGPGKIDMPNGLPMFLIYDYIHIFKNLRNNWITEAPKTAIISY